MKLLFAEDERSLSRAIVHILEKNCYSVDAVYDGQAALEYLENGDYDGGDSGHYDAESRRRHGTENPAQPGMHSPRADAHRQIGN